MSASEALRQAALAAVEAIDGMAAYDAAPVQAVFPYAEVSAGPETDWGHKSAIGREVRLSATIRDAGESPARLRRLMEEAEAALQALGGIAGWQLVTVRFLGSRTVRERGSGRSGGSWAGLIEFRARLLADQVPDEG